MVYDPGNFCYTERRKAGDEMELREKLISLRKKQGMSQLDVAEALHLSRQAISRWEVGTAVPSTDNLKNLSALYGVSVDYLLGQDDGPPEPVSRPKQRKRCRKGAVAACILLAAVLAGGILAREFRAEQQVTPIQDMEVEAAVVPSASFDMSIGLQAQGRIRAESSFPLEAGDLVTIQAAYSPAPASVDFGLVGPDGKYYFVNVTDGSIHQTIQVDQKGSYTLQVRNQSQETVRISGTVKY